MIEYEVFLEDATLDMYRPGYCPREDYVVAGLWPGCIVTGESGRRYHGMRGLGEIAPGMAHTYMFMELNESDLENFSADLYPELPIDQMEPYEYSESGDEVHFTGENIRLDLRPGSCDWHDAGGRFEIHIEHLGQPCTLWVPEQDGIPVPIQHRSQIGRATGQVNGDPVEGLTFLDFSYSHPGVLYFNLPQIRKLEKQWSLWLAEFDDGDRMAGFAWKGRGATGFNASHLVRGNTSQAMPTRTETVYDDRGTVWKTKIDLDGDSVELEQDTCADWPAHTFGRVTATSTGKPIVKSWNYVEWMPDNTEELVDKYLAGEIPVHDAQHATIVDENLIFPEKA